MAIESLNSSNSLSSAKERVFGGLLSEGGGGTSGAYSLASGCAALLIALYGLQSEIALSVAKAAEYKSALAKQIQDDLEAKMSAIQALNEPGVHLNSSDTEAKEKAQKDLQIKNQEYNDALNKGQTEQDILGISSNTLQGYMSQQSQGMQSFIEFMKIVNSQGPFIANLIAR